MGETILKGFQFVHKVKRPEYFKTWLTKILINAAHDCYRKYPQMEDIDALTGMEASMPEPGLSIEEKNGRIRTCGRRMAEP